MIERADSHIHLFYPGYFDALPENCRRVQPDEVTLYDVLREQYSIRQAIVVGYEGQPWAAGNNDYLAALVADHDWLRPLAYLASPDLLRRSDLEVWSQQGFVGLSLYVFDDVVADQIQEMPRHYWQWIEANHWLLSVNSTGRFWNIWRRILEDTPGLRILMSHAGLPPALAQDPVPATVSANLQTVTDLAPYSSVHVKLSGFYGLAKPEHDFPHRFAWPYVEHLRNHFGVDRLLWGSDFSPSLEWVSFPQTISVLEHMPYFSTAEVEQIQGGNLLRLLAPFEIR